MISLFFGWRLLLNVWNLKLFINWIGFWITFYQLDWILNNIIENWHILGHISLGSSVHLMLCLSISLSLSLNLKRLLHPRCTYRLLKLLTRLYPWNYKLVFTQFFFSQWKFKFCQISSQKSDRKIKYPSSKKK